MPTIAPPDPDDTLAVPHFEDRLLDRLYERQRAGAYDGGLDDRDRAAPPDGPRRRSRTRLLAAAAIAAVLAGGAAAVRIAGDTGPTVDTAPTPTGDQPQDTVEQIVAALDAAIGAGSVAHTTGHDGTNEAWVDLRTGAERSITPATTGGKTMDWGRFEPPALDAQGQESLDEVPRRFVDHCLQQYADRREGDLRMHDVVTPPRHLGAGGRLEVAGPAVVDGRELLVLRTAVELPAPTGNPDDDLAAATEALGRQQEVYVDPVTLLPVRLVESSVGVGIDTETGVVDTVPEGSVTTTTDIEILPRTAENLALLVSPVPAGYSRVDQLALDEVRAAGCVA